MLPQHILNFLFFFFIFQSTQENSESLPTEPTLKKPTPIQQSKKKVSNKRQSQTHDDDDILKEAIEIKKKPKIDFYRFGDYVALELKSLKSDYYRKLLRSEIRKSIATISGIDKRNYWFQILVLHRAPLQCLRHYLLSFRITFLRHRVKSFRQPKINIIHLVIYLCKYNYLKFKYKVNISLFQN